MKEREAIEELKSLSPSEEAVETVLKALEVAKKTAKKMEKKYKNLADTDYFSVYLTGIYDRDSVWEERIDNKIEEFRNSNFIIEPFSKQIIEVLEEIKGKKCNDIPS